jgi:hypothetical protein
LIHKTSQSTGIQFNELTSYPFNVLILSFSGICLEAGAKSGLKRGASTNIPQTYLLLLFDYLHKFSFRVGAGIFKRHSHLLSSHEALAMAGEFPLTLTLFSRGNVRKPAQHGELNILAQ